MIKVFSPVQGAHLLRLALFAVTFLTLPACTWVKPWQKADLSRTEMKMEVDPLERQVYRELSARREGAASSTGLQGPGCGCN